jgi:subtilisin family serine protease
VLELTQKARDVQDVARALRATGLVEYAEPDYVVHALAIPSDPLFGQLWGLDNAQDHDIDAPQAWDVTTGSRDVVVAVIDTGVDYAHPDLAANLWRNPGEVPGNFLDDERNGWVDDVFGIDARNRDGDPRDDDDHGTHVAGTLGAVANNGVGIVGVAWNVQIMALKFLGANGSGFTSDAIECFEYAIAMKLDHGVDVRLTSNSWGGYGDSQALADAIAAAAEAGILTLAAAGNSPSGNDNDARPFYPASYARPEIVAVAATDSSDALASDRLRLRVLRHALHEADRVVEWLPHLR